MKTDERISTSKDTSPDKISTFEKFYFFKTPIDIRAQELYR
jgi:hypothetical protein